MRLTATSGVLAALVASCLALSGCGSATVESTDETTEETTSESATATTPESATTTTESATTTAASEEPPADGERPAREVESVPPAGPSYTAEEERFLDEIRNNGVNVEGVEDQLTATGHSLCAGTNVTRDAVAGQLVEQRRTNLDPADLATLIEETAHAHLC
ncbi:hypothetical protein [Corynebacterium timonense]|uniref:Uncharacterized protein n=1 Tax=Corynebacterium timonense TaxID=441500 RepID=A0A1H1V886_9CORY|nr:hypothetical protein [Corynebacterium timonense]SDS80964.1 hypothetical protein SAMN04488539_2441 [Corynebacterium timonense]